MVDNNGDCGRSRRLGAEDRGRSHRSGTQWPDDREVGWRCVRSAPCTWRRGARVSWLSLKTKVDSLSVVLHQNHWNGFLRFGLKTGGNCFSRFGLKTGYSGLSIWASKPIVTVWWFGPQNHHSGFLVCASKPSRLRFVDCASKPMGERRRGTCVKI
jgi:hypothetical protein